jgi:hypothetical protein
LLAPKSELLKRRERLRDWGPDWWCVAGDC